MVFEGVMALPLRQDDDYHFELYEVKPRTKEANSNKRKKPRKNRKLKICKPPDKEKELEKATAIRACLITVCAVLLVACLALFISVNATSYEYTYQIEQMEAKIAEAKSENVRLTNELNSKVSCAEIDRYATTILGMKKTERYQCVYWDLSEGDKVLYYKGMD